MESPVHFYDGREKAPLCRGPIPPPWGWTTQRPKVSCPECLELLRHPAVADGAQGSADGVTPGGGRST